MPSYYFLQSVTTTTRTTFKLMERDARVEKADNVQATDAGPSSVFHRPYSVPDAEFGQIFAFVA